MSDIVAAFTESAVYCNDITASTNLVYVLDMLQAQIQLWWSEVMKIWQHGTDAVVNANSLSK
ncbi:MAG: hypothetical protein IPL21_03105 [Saprospirales bacterium]|nr:hypothetical protein [Saprospirales bacterium]